MDRFARMGAVQPSPPTPLSRACLHELNPRAKVGQADSDLDPGEEGDLHAKETHQNSSSLTCHGHSVRSARLCCLTCMVFLVYCGSRSCAFGKIVVSDVRSVELHVLEPIRDLERFLRLAGRRRKAKASFGARESACTSVGDKREAPVFDQNNRASWSLSAAREAICCLKSRSSRFTTMAI